MKILDPKLISTAILFLLILASGFWVVKLGRPLQTGPFTVHKLLALACLVLMIIIVKELAKGAVLSPLVLTSIVLTFTFFVAMIATGGILSFERETQPALVRLAHKIIPYLTLIASAAAVFLLKK